MRQSVAAFALICLQRGGRRQWLAQWNSHWLRYNLVGGHKREDETFRACIVREIAEELGLIDGEHITVETDPAAHLEYSAWSHSAQEDTQYVFDVFWARLRNPEAEQIVNDNALNKWLDEEEVHTGQTVDGKAVSETMWMVLSEAGLTRCASPGDSCEPQQLAVVSRPSSGEMERVQADDQHHIPGSVLCSSLEPRQGANMNSELRHKTVAVAIMYDQSSRCFLLWHNPRWHGYAFPMKSFDVTSGKSAEQTALDACGEWDIPFPIAKHGPAEPAGRMGDCHYSVGVREYTFYDYHLFGVGLVNIQESALHPDLRFFSFQQLQDAPNVTSSTKRIAEWLVGDRDVVVGVVTRLSTQGREFLLTYTPEHQYFFPSTRLRHDAYPAEEVVRVVQSDLGYEGAIEIVDQVQVDALQESTRFGQLETRFHFHLCLLNLPGTTLAEPGNPLEQSLAGVVSAMAEKRAEAAEPTYWRWCTEEEMRTRGDMSPSLACVLHTALQLTVRTP